MASFENSTVVTTATTNNKKTYEQGLEEAWDIARKIILHKDDGGYTLCDIKKIFNVFGCVDVIKNMSIHEVKAKIDAWEAEKNKPKLGDVVELINVNNGSKLTGIYYGEGIKNIWVLIPEVKVPQQFYSQTWNIKKTGKHFDIQGMLDEIKEVVF